MNQRISAFVLPVALSISMSACLKTRAMLRGDDSDDAPVSKAAPAHVQEVPEGGYAVDELKAEVTRLVGRIEDLEHSNQQQSSGGGGIRKEDLKKLESRVSDLEQAQAQLIEEVKKLEETSTKVNPDEILAKGKSYYKANNCESAIDAFSSYLKVAKKKTEEATYMRAECYFKLKQYKKAIVDYSKFPEKYTHSPLMPSVLYKIGQSFDALGMHEDAKGFYQELVEKFPRSPEAKKAKKRAR